MNIMHVIRQLYPSVGGMENYVRNGASEQVVLAEAAAHTPAPTFVYLQYLRGAAALMVVYFHSVVQMKNLGITAVLPQFGESGVDLFFVLSGFLMWVTTSRSNVTPAGFIRRRLIRIVPLYWGLTLAAGALALIAPQLLKHTVIETTHFISSLLFFPVQNPGYLDNPDLSTRLAPVLIPGWTLNYEMFFYVVFACFVSLKAPLRLVLVPTLFALLCLVGAVGGFGYSALSFYSNPIIFEFVYGIIIAVLVQRNALLRPPLAVALLSVALAVLIFDNVTELPSGRFIVFGLPSALIVYSACCLELTTGARHLRLLKAIGDASYSLYLTHVFTLVLCRLIFTRLTQSGSLLTQCAFVVLCLVLSSLVGIGVYRLYEKPVGQYLGRFK
jgi:exopolysaccharide production protein ExoZ